MSGNTVIHRNKEPIRFHYIPEWADKRGLRQADFARDLDVPKGTVSRWFSGQLPDSKNIVRIAAMLALDEVEQLFRHPDDDWLSKMFKEHAETFRDRSLEEMARIIAMINAAFPKDKNCA